LGREDESSRDVRVPSFIAIGNAGRSGAASERIRTAEFAAGSIFAASGCGSASIRGQLLEVPSGADESFAANHGNRNHAHAHPRATVERRRKASFEVHGSMIVRFSYLPLLSLWGIWKWMGYRCSKQQ
jgi:hypothetical protein